jgi:colanic acid/amylovoran biosynthesis glycosyltransferase
VKIATFHTTYLGYTETFIYSQLLRLHQVERASFALAGQNLERFPLDKLYIKPPTRRSVTLCNNQLVPWLYKGLRDEGAQLIHAHFGTAGRVILPYASWLGLPLVVSYYGFDVGYLVEPEKHPNYASYTKSIQRLFHGAALHLALTQEMRGILTALGCPPEKLRVHYNGVDVQRFTPSERPESEEFTIFMCGREVEKKGFAYGFEAISQARRVYPKLKVSFLGANGPLRPRLEQQIQRLDLQSVVCFASDREGLIPLLWAADAILAPSVTASDGDREGLPTVLVEAAACGVPAIASRHAGIPELVRHEQTGLLCDERDVEGLTRAILLLAQHKTLRRALGQNARHLAVEQFDIERLTDTLQGYYREMLRR